MTSFYLHQFDPNGRPGTTEMGTLVSLIDETIRKGVPHASEKSQPAPTVTRDRSAGIRGRRRGKFTLTDGPFAETKELIGGAVC